jgi:hypothetical protein
VGQRAFGAGEVDQHLRILQAGTQVGGDGHAAGMAQEGGGVCADGRAGRLVQRAGQHAVVQARMASISMWPMRPEAPATATRCLSVGRRQRVEGAARRPR